MYDAIATAHAPQATIDREIECDRAAAGIGGLGTALGRLMTLVHDGAIDLPTLIARLTSGPAQAWNLERRTGVDGIGTLAPGAPGDIALLDPDAEWTVDQAEFASLGKNTPLAGRTLRGRVVATVFAGEIVHSLEGVGAL